MDTVVLAHDSISYGEDRGSNRIWELVEDDGHSLGEHGVQSPWLPKEYLDNPDQSAMSFNDGWLRSGDLPVRYPLGSFYVMDRIRGAIKSGEEWIAGSSIESVISEVPGVKSVAIIANPDERWGERA
jgi:acyl-CoA synthetase (AMP-forming)/AMP-acid ligase II